VIVSNAVYVVSSDKAVLTVVPVTPPSVSLTNLHLFAASETGHFPLGSDPGQRRQSLRPPRRVVEAQSTKARYSG